VEAAVAREEDPHRDQSLAPAPGLMARRAPRIFVYVLGSTGKGGRRTYVGWTLDVERRLVQHNAGKGAKSTRGRVWVLLYAEAYHDRAHAMSREWHLKRDRAFRKRLSAGLT
jgi:putative endonuclease